MERRKNGEEELEVTRRRRGEKEEGERKQGGRDGSQQHGDTATETLLFPHRKIKIIPSPSGGAACCPPGDRNRP